MVIKNDSTNKTAADIYRYRTGLFFASSDKFIESFDFKVIESVTIDLSGARDVTSVSALDKVWWLKVSPWRGHMWTWWEWTKPRRTIVDKFGVHDKPERSWKAISRTLRKTHENIIACIDGANSTTSTCEASAWVANEISSISSIPRFGSFYLAVVSEFSGQIGLGQEELLEELAELDEARSKIMLKHINTLLEEAQKWTKPRRKRRE